MKILHTSDWHLGSMLGIYSREYEYSQFFNFIFELINEEKINALIISGDLFDGISPNQEIINVFNSFVINLKEKFPSLKLIISSGRNDSLTNLSAISEFFNYLDNVLITNKIFQRDNFSAILDDLIVPLKNDEGVVEAYCGCVPFLKFVEQLNVTNNCNFNNYLDIQKFVYSSLLDRMKNLAMNSEKLIVTGYSFVEGIQVSFDVENLNLDNYIVPKSFFDGFDYVAMGGIHMSQHIEESNIYYSGSPIPLDFAESSNRNKVILIEIAKDKNPNITSIPVPRFVDFYDIPTYGPVHFDKLIEELDKIKINTIYDDNIRPFVRLNLLLNNNISNVQKKLTTAVLSKGLRLVKVVKHNEFIDEDLQDDFSISNSQFLEKLFISDYKKEFLEEPNEKILQLLRDIVINSLRDSSDKGGDIL